MKLNLSAASIVAILYILPCAAHSTIYSWTGDDGTVNYTDDLTKVPKKNHSTVIKTEADSVADCKMPDITGSWCNNKTGFARMGFYFANDGRLFSTGCQNILQKQIPTSDSKEHWKIDSYGNIVITPPLGSKERIVKGIFNNETETICLLSADEKECSTLTRVQ